MIKSLLSQNLVHYHFGMRKINEHENHIGQQTLSWSNTHYPLDIININSIVNTNGTNTATGSMLKALQTDGYSFSGIENVSLQNKYGGTTTQGIDEVKSLYHRWSKINLCLWADTLRATIFKVYLVKLKDRVLDPYDSRNDSTSAEVQDARKQLYLQYFLNNQLSHPIVPPSKISKDIFKKFDIVWRKTYIIDEQLNDRDQRPHRIVKLFRRNDRLISYNRNEALVANNVDNPESIATINNDSNKKAYPVRTSDQLFMVITANCTKSQAEDGVNYHKATYDLLVESKYTTIPNVIQ